MNSARQYIYIHWYDTGEVIEAGTVAAARAMVRERYPAAHFDDWEDAPNSIRMPVWASSAQRLRYELGETQDENKPVAYVFMQDWRIAERWVQAEGNKQHPPRICAIIVLSWHPALTSEGSTSRAVRRQAWRARWTEMDVTLFLVLNFALLWAFLVGRSSRPAASKPVHSKPVDHLVLEPLTDDPADEIFGQPIQEECLLTFRQTAAGDLDYPAAFPPPLDLVGTEDQAEEYSGAEALGEDLAVLSSKLDRLTVELSQFMAAQCDHDRAVVECICQLNRRMTEMQLRRCDADPHFEAPQTQFEAVRDEMASLLDRLGREFGEFLTEQRHDHAAITGCVHQLHALIGELSTEGKRSGDFQQRVTSRSNLKSHSAEVPHGASHAPPVDVQPRTAEDESPMAGHEDLDILDQLVQFGARNKRKTWFRRAK